MSAMFQINYSMLNIFSANSLILNKSEILQAIPVGISRSQNGKWQLKFKRKKTTENETLLFKDSNK